MSSDQISTQLYMGELDPWWDEQSIKSLWNTLGFTQLSVKLIKERVQQQAQNAGYCFLQFPTPEVASSALAHNGQKIPNTNKFLKLNWANGNSNNNNNHNNNNGYNNNSNHHHHHNNSNGSNNNSSNNQNRNNEVSVFVGDLSPDVTETHLFELFGSRYQSVSSTKIMADQSNGQSKGYGFVRFLNELDQQKALMEMQGAILGGRPIRVSTAVPKNRQQHQQSQDHQQQQHYNNGGGGGSGGSRQQYHQQQPIQAHSTGASISSNPQTQQILGSLEAQYQPPLTQYTDPNNTTVFIGGLSSLVTEEDLKLYFQPFGDITYVKIPIGKGCGFVQYVTRASAEMAIAKMQAYPIGNSRLRLSWGRSNSQTNVNNSNSKSQQYMPQQELPTLYGYSPINPISATLHQQQQQLNGQQQGNNQLSLQSVQSSNNHNPSVFPPFSGFLTNSDYGPAAIQNNPMDFSYNGVPTANINDYNNSVNVNYGTNFSHNPNPNLNAITNMNANMNFDADAVANSNVINPINPEVVDQSRLNQLFMAARNGRLDAIESASNGYVFA